LPVPSPAGRPVVTTDAGVLSGIIDPASGVFVFRGVPYAAPPVGESRWRAPRPLASWSGVRSAEKLGKNCIQDQVYSDIDAFAAGISEDCLFLNVWTQTANATASRPVMVWIYGGGYTAGFGGEERHNGSRLAQKGAVVVTLNYRLGIFGFFAHPALGAENSAGAAGNYAIMDQVAALKWVQRNIAQFGGDPARVTIFGESAGGNSVGALIGSPLADRLMKHFASADGVGVWQTFLVLAAVYLVFMLGGAFGYRVPPADWQPAGWTPPATAASATTAVHLANAHRTPQFWLIWLVLLLNVSASIGIIGIASPMIQEIFAGRLFNRPDVAFTGFDAAQKIAAAAAGAGFVGFISLFNIGGRFFWASISDRLGRKPTYAVMLATGALLYAVIAPWSASAAALTVFALAFAVIVSMYGGGFATVPAYLADVFGTQFVGAIHGRLLTAWSTAGILGPLIVTRMRDAAIAAGTPRAEIYPPIFWTLAGLLVAGFVANLFIRPVGDRFRMTAAEVAALRGPEATVGGDGAIGLGRFDVAVALAWLPVALPLAWGLSVTVTKALALFTH